MFIAYAVQRIEERLCMHKKKKKNTPKLWLLVLSPRQGCYWALFWYPEKAEDPKSWGNLLAVQECTITGFGVVSFSRSQEKAQRSHPCLQEVAEIWGMRSPLPSNLKGYYNFDNPGSTYWWPTCAPIFPSYPKSGLVNQLLTCHHLTLVGAILLLH